MARSRLIKPGLAKNEVLAELGPHAQLLFAMLSCYADREGRLEDRPKRLKAEIFPYYEVDVDALLQGLADCDEHFIERYEIDGKRYLQITNFNAHQSPHHKENESDIPACPKHESSMSQAQSKHDNPGSHAPYRVKVTSNKNKDKDKNKEDVELVVMCYQSHHPRAKAGEKERTKIRQRLREGFTVEDITLAIGWLSRQPWHSGQNPEGRKYQSLELIVRDASKVTQFIELAGENGDTQLSEKSRRSLNAINNWLSKSNGGAA